MGMNKTVTLKTLFTQFLVTLILFLLLAVAVPVLLLLGGVDSGFLTPANTSEAALQKAQTEIAAVQVFSTDLVPPGMEYALLDKSLTLLETDMNNNNAEKAVLFAKGKYNNTSFGDRFSLITRDNDYVVIKYSMHSRYVYESLNEVLPPPEIMLYILIGINAVIVCVVATLVFARKVKRQILPLHKATQQIGNQNLDFDIGHSHIRELNDVLLSFGEMKEELKGSLEKQWKEEQEQREQIAALAHDLKTPLTVMYGNLDLLQETELNAEQTKYVKSLLENSGYMETSIATLIELSKATSGYSLQISAIKTTVFLEALQQKITSLTILKDIRIEFLVHDLPDTLQCDPALLGRAILNVVSNAVDFTPKCGIIRLEVKQEHNSFVFTVTDSGKGFSQDDLAQGKQRFYMGDLSRSSRQHYGMGLTIADNIIRQHNGKLILGNGAGDLCGARVILSIPV